jgi:hypothetical protein
MERNMKEENKLIYSPLLDLEENYFENICYYIRRFNKIILMSI